MNRNELAKYNGCTHAFTFKEDNTYKLFIGDEDWRGFFEKSFKTFKEAKNYACEFLPDMIFYRANH